MFVTAAGFISDAITVGNSLTSMRGCGSITAVPSVRTCPCSIRRATKPTRHVRGLRHAVYLERVVAAAWRHLKLTADSRTMLRASYGRFNQGVLTGELAPFHPAATPLTTATIDHATGGYTRA